MLISVKHALEVSIELAEMRMAHVRRIDPGNRLLYEAAEADLALMAKALATVAEFKARLP